MKNSQHLQGRTRQQALRFLKPVPEGLADYINLANIVPHEPYMRRINDSPHVSFVGELRNVDMKSIDISDRWQDETFDLILSYLKDFPDYVRDYFISFAAEVGKMGAIQHYEEIQQAHERLRVIVRLVREAEESKITNKPPPFRPFALPIETFIFLDDQGRLRVSMDDFAAAVRNIEAWRIRNCANCKRFFWAGRKDQKCCSKKCNGAYRVRRFREAYAKDPVGYAQRRAAREYEASQKRIQNPK
jgi:hypothetical protein